MSAQTTVVTGWQVVRREPKRRGGEREIPLSRVFVVRAAAEDFAALLRAGGGQCQIIERHGVDDLGITP